MNLKADDLQCVRIYCALKQLVDKYGGIKEVIREFYLTSKATESNPEYVDFMTVSYYHFHPVHGSCQKSLCLLLLSHIHAAIDEVRQERTEARKRDID
ncbi:hypothetical protein ACFL0Z_02220 [Patescibacteria group bacterium]